MFRSRLIALIAVLIACAPARATILTEVGDFSDDPFAPALFFLTEGSNTISGSLDEGDRDYILFINFTGEPVTSQRVISAGFSDGGSDGPFGVWGCEFEELSVGCTGSNVFPTTILPLEFGPILEGVQFSDNLNEDACLGGCSYVAEIYVGERPPDEVPEPSTWLLTGGALSGLWLRRKRGLR